MGKCPWPNLCLYHDRTHDHLDMTYVFWIFLLSHHGRVTVFRRRAAECPMPLCRTGNCAEGMACVSLQRGVLVPFLDNPADRKAPCR
jgi:hypothetical protein